MGSPSTPRRQVPSDPGAVREHVPCTATANGRAQRSDPRQSQRHQEELPRFVGGARASRARQGAEVARRSGRWCDHRPTLGPDVAVERHPVDDQGQE
jgi:hypothetical protein